MSFRINTNSTSMSALRNINQVSQSFSQSVNKLSTGLRITSAADDPAGLIFSENFRAQIGGITQAVRNNQDAINYAKTAEGALDEISRLLREGRALTVASANTAVLSTDQLQANQTQWNLMVSSIDRIANETQFGTKKLLDGSSGVTASITNAASIAGISVSGTFNGGSISGSGAIGVNVTTAATKATLTGTNTVVAASQAAYLSTAVGAASAGNFYINGHVITATATDTWDDVIKKINLVAETTGVTADSVYTGGAGAIRLTSSTHGTKGNFDLSDTGVLQSSAGTSTATGIDAVADVTIGGNTVTFQGGRFGYDGLALADLDGNVIKLQVGTGTGVVANAAYLTVGSAQFQTGPNANNRTTLNIGSFTSTTLNIDLLDMTSQSGAQAALEKIDEALSNLNRRRGEIGSFMRNVLESNVRSLGIAKENLSATESNVRDVDMAEEMTNYTRLQILQQSGLAMLAQANQAPQAVLSLLGR